VIGRRVGTAIRGSKNGNRKGARGKKGEIDPDAVREKGSNYESFKTQSRTINYHWPDNGGWATRLRITGRHLIKIALKRG